MSSCVVDVTASLIAQVNLLRRVCSNLSPRRQRELILHSAIGIAAKRDKVVVDDPDSSDDEDDDEPVPRFTRRARRSSSTSTSDEDSDAVADVQADGSSVGTLSAEEAFDLRDDEDDIAGTTVWYGCNMCYGFEPTLVEGNAWKHLLIGPSSSCDRPDLAQSTRPSPCRTTRKCGRCASSTRLSTRTTRECVADIALVIPASSVHLSCTLLLAHDAQRRPPVQRAHFRIGPLALPHAARLCARPAPFSARPRAPRRAPALDAIRARDASSLVASIRWRTRSRAVV